MKLSGAQLIYRGHIRSRSVLVQSAFAVLGLAIGVALLFGSQISSTSLTHSAAQLNTRALVGASQVQLDARGPEGFSESVLEAVRRAPGVESTFPVLERQVNVIGTSGERSIDLIGVEPSALRATIPLLRRFSANLLRHAHGIALPQPLEHEISAGAVVKLQVGARFASTLVGATLTKEDIGGLIDTPVAVTSVYYEQILTREQGRLSRIFVHYRPAQAAVAHRALAGIAARSGVTLNRASFDSRLFAVAVAPESESELLFSGISALVGFMFAVNAMLITIPSRRWLIENLREQGASPKDTVQVLLLEAFAIGGLACLLGLALGDLLSVVVFHTQPGYLSFAFPVGSGRTIAWQSVVLAVLVGMLAAIFGVMWPVRHILGRRPGSPRDAMLKLPPARALLGVGLAGLAITTAVLIADPRAAVFGNATLILSLVCLLPLLFEFLLSVFAAATRLRPRPAAAMAIDELRTPQTRVRSLAVALLAAVAVCGVVEFQGVSTNLKHGLDASARDLDSSADIWITPRGSSSLLTTVPFAPVNEAAITRIKGVSHIGVYRGAFFDWNTRRLWVIAPPRNANSVVPASQLPASTVARAAASVRAGGWATLSRAVASEHHLHVGDWFTLPSPHPLALRLAGVTTNLGWPPGAIILNAADYARGWVATEPTAYEVQTRSAAAVPAVRGRIARLLHSPGLGVETAAERERRHFALAAQGLARLSQIRLLVIVSAIFAIVAAMGSLLWQRHARIAFNRSNGITKGVLWRSLVWESALLLGSGSLIGAVWGLYAQLLGSHFLSVVTGFPVVFSIEGFAAIAGFALTGVPAVLLLAAPGYLAVRVRPRSISPAY